MSEQDQIEIGADWLLSAEEEEKAAVPEGGNKGNTPDFIKELEKSTAPADVKAAAAAAAAAGAEGGNGNEDENKPINWDDEETDWDEIKEEAPEPDEEELERLNKVFGTNVATVEEAREKLKSIQGESNNQNAENLLSEEEQRTYISLQNYKKLGDMELARLDYEDNLRKSIERGIINDESLFTRTADGKIKLSKEEVDFRFDEYKSSKGLELNSRIDELKKQIDTAISQLDEKNKTLNKAAKESEQEATQKSRKALQSELKNLHTFMDIEIDGKDRAEVYRDVISGKFFKSATKTDKDVAELAILHRLYKQGKLEQLLVGKGVNKGKLAKFQSIKPHQKSGSQGISAPKTDAISDTDYSSWGNFGYTNQE